MALYINSICYQKSRKDAEKDQKAPMADFILTEDSSY